MCVPVKVIRWAKQFPLKVIKTKIQNTDGSIDICGDVLLKLFTRTRSIKGAPKTMSRRVCRISIPDRDSNRSVFLMRIGIPDKSWNKLVFLMRISTLNKDST